MIKLFFVAIIMFSLVLTSFLTINSFFNLNVSEPIYVTETQNYLATPYLAKPFVEPIQQLEIIEVDN